MNNTKNSLSPLERYHQDIQQNKIQADEAQERAVNVLDKLYWDMKSTYPTVNLFSFFIKDRILKGVYLWGGVGRGKTYLMDLFFDAVPHTQNTQKKRIHFHRFMQTVHQSLKEHQGVKNPLAYIAKQWAKKTKVLCLDEFFVDDIVDAMILGELFKSLFNSGIIVVITSNQHPSQLYLNGLQRDKFLPAIRLIEQYTDIISLDETLDEKKGLNIDYRFRILTQAELYHYPIDKIAMQNLERYFDSLVPHYHTEQLVIFERIIQTIRLASDVVWFDFEMICATPRSSADYIEIARRFHTVFVSNVPIMGSLHEASAKRFISMIDTFYDRQVKIVMCAQSAPSDLYQGQLWMREFQRTISRLTEMRSQVYLSKPHLS